MYGTLQPGHLRWRFLAPFAVGHRPAAVVGALYDSGNGWPVAIFAADGAGAGAPAVPSRGSTTGPAGPSPGFRAVARMIPGTLVELDGDRLDEALEVLDRVENTAADLLRRIAVVTVDGIEAWAYDWPGSTVGFALIDRWDGVDER